MVAEVCCVASVAVVELAPKATEFSFVALAKEPIAVAFSASAVVSAPRAVA